MNRKIIKYYETPEGKQPFVVWLNSIKDLSFKRRILLRLNRLTDGNFGDCKSLGNGLYEFRLDFGSGYRIYYTEEDKVIIILFSGGDKSTQVRDIAKAKSYLKEYRGD
ncbi:MAG: type II toxin-antitoxin system RelE/ParE family toxin [bacterium]